MSFLKFIPSVFAFDGEYCILVVTNEAGLCAVNIGDETYYSACAGTLITNSLVHKIRVDMKALDEAGEYTVVFGKTLNKKSYFSKFAERECESFEFFPVPKGKDVSAYHLADVHKRFDEALECAAHYGERSELYIVNGDIGEVEKEESFYDIIEFLGKLARGNKPIIFSRGNHDARGKMAENFCDYFPSEEGKTYFRFTVGDLRGIVLDCGEDKPDANDEYGGANIFELFRREQTKFLKAQTPSDVGLFFAVSHICPMMTSYEKGSVFDIERELYQEWTAELERLDTRFMLCGHMHDSFVLGCDDERSFIDHNFPAVFASHLREDGFWGAFVRIRDNTLYITMNDRTGAVREEYTVEI